MRRIVVIVPGLLGDPSFLRQKLPTLDRIAELGRLFKLSPMPSIETTEALYLGLRPDEGQLRQGPLTISALNADPPDRSTHFHLSLMSFTDGTAREIKLAISPEEQGVLHDLAKKLNTKSLTVVGGEGVDHGLVWEAFGDLRTYSPPEVDGKEMRSRLPEGDGDVALRRFIDDSINLLSELEMNERRIDEELPPLNLLWPWGQGVRRPVPNLALRRGEPALVMSSSLRLQGLSRLAGYRHWERHEFGNGTNTRLSKIVDRALREPVSIVVVDAVQEFRGAGKLEEADWFVRELDSALLQPLFEEALKNPTRIAFLAPGSEVGLGTSFATRDANSNSTPFDERALEERSLSAVSLWDAVVSAL
jgi:hypothetical protein